MGVTELSAVLWQERRLLELLLFKLEEEQRVLSSEGGRWLGNATRGIEQVLDQIRETELGRAMEAHAVARDLSIGPTSDLFTLSTAAPTPWDELLTGHCEALVALTSQIDEAAEENRRMLRSAIHANTIPRSNDDTPAVTYELRLREIGYRAALGGMARVLQPSLLAFVSSGVPTLIP